jgi:hypothetical protein
MGSNNIFVDTSWFKAFLDPADDFHSQSERQYLMIKDRNTHLVTSNYIVDETLTLLRVRKNLELSLQFRDMLMGMSHSLKLIRVTSQDEFKAWDWFPKNWSKLSFTDCTSFAVMERLELKDVATFDQHFAQVGFNVIS